MEDEAEFTDEMTIPGRVSTICVIEGPEDWDGGAVVGERVCRGQGFAAGEGEGGGGGGATGGTVGGGVRGQGAGDGGGGVAVWGRDVEVVVGGW